MKYWNQEIRLDYHFDNLLLEPNQEIDNTKLRLLKGRSLNANFFIQGIEIYLQ